MVKLAASVVLLLPEDVMGRVIEISRNLSEVSDDSFVLNKEDYLPHLTLAMGVIEEEDFFRIERKLKGLVEEHLPLRINISEVKVSVRPDGQKASSLVVKKTKELQKVHESVMEEMSDFFTYDANVSMFFTPPAVRELPLSWVKNYVRTSVYENYKPHITLGVGVAKETKLVIEFDTSKIALCHLGNYCTCRKILVGVV